MKDLLVSDTRTEKRSFSVSLRLLKLAGITSVADIIEYMNALLPIQKWFHFHNFFYIYLIH